jgi:hypothetical protein
MQREYTEEVHNTHSRMIKLPKRSVEKYISQHYLTFWIIEIPQEEIAL